MEGAIESAEWRVSRLERVVGSQEAREEGESTKTLGQTAQECAKLQAGIVKTLPDLEAFWRLHSDFEEALRVPADVSATRAAIQHAADVLDDQTVAGQRPPQQNAESLMEDAESLRKELERARFGAPEQSSAVYNAPEYRARLERVAERSAEQAKQAAELRARILALVKANVQFTQDASAQLLALDALIAKQGV